MALITCPECGKQVSSAAQLCPTCGYPIAQKTDNKVLIRIDRLATQPLAWCTCVVKGSQDVSNKAQPGGIITLEIKEPTEVYFVTGFKSSDFFTIYPGKKYLATWQQGMFGGLKITALNEVDVMNF